jgi:hypothetical protein
MRAYFTKFKGKVRESSECDRIDIVTSKYTIAVLSDGLAIFRNPRESKKHPGKILGRKEKLDIKFREL